MNKLPFILLPLAILLPLSAVADPDKNESGKGNKHKREFKEEFWDGNCKVERKLEGNGDYKEERKCKGARQADHGYRDDRRDYRQAQPGIVVTVPDRVYRAAEQVRVEPVPRVVRKVEPARVYRKVEPAPLTRKDPYSNID